MKTQKTKLAQVITDKYAIYNGDCVDVMRQMPDGFIHASIHSPPFGGRVIGYSYSSDPRDLSNCDSYQEFLQHYEFVVQELHRITMPGRMAAVHCMDIANSNSGSQDSYIDFPGDIIRMFERNGFKYAGRHTIWKEPLTVRNRTRQKNLFHKTACEDSLNCGLAAADFLLLFRKVGKNKIPVAHPCGFLEYMGEKPIPAEAMRYKGFEGDQLQNKYSHWIWRQYASSVWDDIRLNHVLPYRDCKEEDDEKHVHPLQLDVIERFVQLRTNPGETVFTPFMGVGSEVYVPVLRGRRGIGVELKESYFRQAVKNLEAASNGFEFNKRHDDLFDGMDEM